MYTCDCKLTSALQVLNDKARLIKRTQLKRFASTVLGKRQRLEKGVPSDGEEEESPDGTLGRPHKERDAHLRDCDEEIFDDEDFYHRVGGRGEVGDVGSEQSAVVLIQRVPIVCVFYT